MHEVPTTSVLLVDDEPNMLRTLSAILTREGYDVTATDDSEQAVKLCTQRMFDVVLMDVRMPKFSGIEAFRRIRRHREGARVILMSAFGEAELKEAALNEGAIAFIDKPLDVEKVIHLVADIGETTILVVENDDDVVRMLVDPLQQRGYHVTATGSPHEALELVEQIRFDVILIDVDLPMMNGLELYLAIKKITPTSVALMVSGRQAEFIELARKAVAQTAYTFIAKPIELENLFDLLTQIRIQTASECVIKPEEPA